MRRRAIFLALALTAACGRPPAENRYAPLTAGRSWRYHVTSRGFGGDGEAYLETTNLAPRRLWWRTVTPQRMEVGSQRSLVFVGLDDRGVYRYATQSPETAEPQYEASPVYFLVYPLTVGKTWEEESMTAFLPTPTRLTLKSRVQSAGEEVQVAAGRFTDCVRIRSEGMTRVPIPGSDTRFGFVTGQYDTWLAPDVGMVKAEVDELMNAIPGYASMNVSIALESFTP